MIMNKEWTHEEEMEGKKRLRQRFLEQHKGLQLGAKRFVGREEESEDDPIDADYFNYMKMLKEQE